MAYYRTNRDIRIASCNWDTFAVYCLFKMLIFGFSRMGIIVNNLLGVASVTVLSGVESSKTDSVNRRQNWFVTNHNHPCWSWTQRRRRRFIESIINVVHSGVFNVCRHVATYKLQQVSEYAAQTCSVMRDTIRRRITSCRLHCFKVNTSRLGVLL